MSKIEDTIKIIKATEFIEKLGLQKYATIHKDGVVDVDAGVGIHDMNLTKIPIQFGRITHGYFDCSNNNLTSLKGAPEYVDGDFDCMCNNLKTLDGCPKYIEGGFDCDDNPNLESLDGIGKVDGMIRSKFFRGHWNKFIKTEFFKDHGQERTKIDIILKNYNIKNASINDDLTVDVRGDVNLHGKNLYDILVQFGRVTGDFDCSDNYISHLKECPEYVEGDFNCSSNYMLETLEDCPKYVGGDFICTNNKQIKSLKGIGKVDGIIYSDFFKGKLEDYSI